MLNVLLVVGVLIGVYALFPTGGGLDAALITRLILGLVITVVLIVWQVFAIRRSRRPIARAVRGLAVCILTFLVVFALSYDAMSHSAPHSFSTHLDKIDAMYFTVTTFATVGFGDITPVTDFARIVTTVQMLLDLAVIAVTARLLFHTATGTVDKRRRSQSSASTETGDSTQSAT